MSGNSPSKHLYSSTTRRDFLKISCLGMIGAFLPTDLIARLDESQSTRQENQALGRVFQDRTFLYQKAFTESDVIEEMSGDSVYRITGYAINREDPLPNRIWYNLDEKGYTHSKNIQPVQMRFNQPALSIPETGCLGEVTIPFIDAYSRVDNRRKLIYRLYYSATIWVTGREVNSYGSVWYQILDDRNHAKLYVPSYAIRLVPEDELTPLSADLPFDQKQLVVDLDKQSLTAYEGERVVNRMRVSTGVRTNEGGFATSRGAYRTNTKRPCRHMYAPPSEFGTGFDLPGVPWICYFTRDGVAFHGAYWQNNFGVPYSHGCINMSPQAAKWIYRWTTPSVPVDKYFFASNEGTKVLIV